MRVWAVCWSRAVMLLPFISWLPCSCLLTIVEGWWLLELSLGWAGCDFFPFIYLQPYICCHIPS
jgi:hypothetical protein